MPIVLSEVSRILLLIMYALLSKAVNGYHFVKDKYLEYKYTTDEIHPTERYFLTPTGREEDCNHSKVPTTWVYIEEWMDTKGHKKMIAMYEGEVVPTDWTHTPFELPPARCPWVWVGDKETEIDMTRTFDKFLVAGNQIRIELVEKLIKITDRTKLIYIESGTLKEIEFPGDGITIETNE
jgi:hypothetical protein